MGETAPPLGELAARKRLAQAHMELQRAELALAYQQATAPFRLAQSKLHSLTSQPGSRWALLGGLGFLLISKRFRFLRRTVGWVLPFVLPRIRGLAGQRAMQLGLKGVQLLLRRK